MCASMYVDYTHSFVFIYIYIYLYIYTCIYYIYMYVIMHMWVCVYINIYLCLYMYQGFPVGIYSWGDKLLAEGHKLSYKRVIY